MIFSEFSFASEKNPCLSFPVLESTFASLLGQQFLGIFFVKLSLRDVKGVSLRKGVLWDLLLF